VAKSSDPYQNVVVCMIWFDAD